MSNPESPRSKAERPTFESLNSQLDTCLKFANTAQLEYTAGHRESAEQSHIEAEQGYTVAVTGLPQVPGLAIEQRHTLEAKMEQLRHTLAHLNQKQ